jgi:hypothetical protein
VLEGIQTYGAIKTFGQILEKNEIKAAIKKLNMTKPLGHQTSPPT